MKRIANNLIALALMAFTFASCEDVPSPFGKVLPPGHDDDEKIVIDPTGQGTEADPFNVSAVIQFTSALKDGEVKSDIYTKGYIVTIDDIDTSGTYGNATYWISDDKEGKSGLFEVYRGIGLGGQKFNEKDATIIKAGDEVIIKGNVKNFQGKTPEYDTGSILVELNGTKAGEKEPEPTAEIGTKDNPITVAQALEVIKALEDNGESADAYVKGKISKVQSFNSKYSSITYYISDDGTETNELQIYSGKNIGGAEFASIDDLAAGDEVVVKGKLKKFIKNGEAISEMNQPNEIISIVKGSSGDNTPTPTSDLGTQDAPITVAKALEYINGMEDNAETETEAFVKGKISKVQSFNSKYSSITYYISDDGTEANELQIYSGKNIGGAAFAAQEDLAAGDEVVVKGKLKKFVNTKTGAVTLEMNQPNEIISIVKASGGGGGEGGGEITAAFADLDCSNVASIKLSDGTTIALAQEDGKSAPIYHESTKLLRIYARNSITVNAGNKKIAKVVFAYDTYSGTAYKGNDEMYGEAGGNKITPTKDDKNVTFSGVNNSTLKAVNWLESGNSGGTQFRVTGITIQYQ